MGGWSSRPVKANYDERDLSHWNHHSPFRIYEGRKINTETPKSTTKQCEDVVKSKHPTWGSNN